MIYPFRIPAAPVLSSLEGRNGAPQPMVSSPVIVTSLFIRARCNHAAGMPLAERTSAASIFTIKRELESGWLSLGHVVPARPWTQSTCFSDDCPIDRWRVNTAVGSL